MTQQDINHGILQDAQAAETWKWLPRGYTGHEHLLELDIINMNARLYDPTLARMLSPDNMLGDPTNTQAYNKYSYVINNPLKYTDPTGNDWIGALIGLAGSLTGFMRSPVNATSYFGGGSGGVAASAGQSVAGQLAGGALGFIGGFLSATNANANSVAVSGSIVQANAQSGITDVKKVSFTWSITGTRWFYTFGEPILCYLLSKGTNQGQLDVTFSIIKQNGVYTIGGYKPPAPEGGKDVILSPAQFDILESTDTDPNLHLTISSQATGPGRGSERSVTPLGVGITDTKAEFSRSIPFSVNLQINKLTGDVSVESYSPYFGVPIKYTSDSFLETLQPVFIVSHSEITVTDSYYNKGSASTKSHRKHKR